jgi:hypothetical protein
MKKEILVKIVIGENDEWGSIIQKIGFNNSLIDAQAIVHNLRKVAEDENKKLESRMNTITDYTVKERIKEEDDGC